MMKAKCVLIDIVLIYTKILLLTLLEILTDADATVRYEQTLTEELRTGN
jgi:hypothetical protein